MLLNASDIIWETYEGVIANFMIHLYGTVQIERAEYPDLYDTLTLSAQGTIGTATATEPNLRTGCSLCY